MAQSTIEFLAAEAQWADELRTLAAYGVNDYLVVAGFSLSHGTTLTHEDKFENAYGVDVETGRGTRLVYTIDGTEAAEELEEWFTTTSKRDYHNAALRDFADRIEDNIIERAAETGLAPFGVDYEIQSSAPEGSLEFQNDDRETLLFSPDDPSLFGYVPAEARKNREALLKALRRVERDRMGQ